MKKVTLSTAAALLFGSSLFAVDTKIENVKVEGAAGLYYWTDDQGANGKHFDQPSSSADAFVSLKATADLNKKIKGGIAATTVTTLGLENNLVSNTFSRTHPNVVDDYTVVTEAWIEISAGEKTTATLGRQKLDTPLVFSEKWNVMPNTYEAAVIANKSIKNLTLIGAFVGRGNGIADTNTSTVGSNGGSVLNTGGTFVTFGNDNNASNNNGAYALGAVYNSGDLTAQLWGYNVSNLADAYWAQIDYAPKNGINVGLQYTDLAFKVASVASSYDSSAYAAKVGYTKKDAYEVFASFSQTDDTTGNGGVAFNVGGGSQSKLYTEAWWNRGYVTRDNTSAMNLTAKYSWSKSLELALYVTQTDSTVANVNQDMTEGAITVAKSYDDLKATLAYIHTDAEDQNIVSGTTGDAFGTIQIYLDAKF